MANVWVSMASWRQQNLVGVILSLLLLAYAVRSTAGSGEEGEKTSNASWKDCEVFLAPSSLPTGGWGVYAGRSFEKNEIVEIAPRFLPAVYDASVVKNSVLDDYIYGYLRWKPREREFFQLAAVVLGNVMFYNHHPTPNIKWISFGREPSDKEPHISQATGFVAKKDIEAGEELFSTYGSEDGGVVWFKDRQLEMKELPVYMSRKNGTTYKMDKQKYCSKVHAGVGKPSWNRVMESTKIGNGKHWPYRFNTDRLAPEDHAAAIVKQDVTAGTVLEMSPALVLSGRKTRNTLLAAVSIFWRDWDDEQRAKLQDLRASGELVVQHQSFETRWRRSDWFAGFEDVVIFPAAGKIGMIEKVGHSGDFNCLLRIVSSGSMKSYESYGGTDGSAGILLELVATKDLREGDRLRLRVGFNASPLEKHLLAAELHMSGQPVPDFLARHIEMPREEL